MLFKISWSLLLTNAYWVLSGRRQYILNTTSPLVQLLCLFFFNLFIKALYQIFKYCLYLIIAFFALVYYLNNFIFILYLGISYILVIYIYNFIIILLSFSFNTTKDSCGMVLNILGYQININIFFLSFSPAKQMVL